MAKKKTAKKATKPKKTAAKKSARLKAPIITKVPVAEKWDFKKIIAQMQADREKREKATKKEISAIAEELFLLGVKKVVAEYSGEGDSGDVNYVAYEKLHDKIKVPEDTDSKLKDLVWALLPSGFENNDGGYGEVTIDTADKKVRVEHHQRIIETSDSEEEFEL